MDSKANHDGIPPKIQIQIPILNRSNMRSDWWSKEISRIQILTSGNSQMNSAAIEVDHVILSAIFGPSKPCRSVSEVSVSVGILSFLFCDWFSFPSSWRAII